MVIKYLECPMIVYSSYKTLLLNVYTKEGQMQERHSLTEFAKKQAA